MSFDNQATLNIPNTMHAPPKKSSPLKWILGGCGCLSFMVIACVGGLVWFGMSKVSTFREECKSLSTNSSVVQNNLGSPVEVVGESMKTGPNNSIVMELELNGPKGNGTTVFNGVMSPETMEYEATSSFLKFDGKEIDLNAADEYNIDITGEN